MSKEILWTTQDGRKLKVCEMSTEHIQNCVSMIKQSGFISAKKWYAYLYTSPRLSENAMDAYMQELDTVLSKRPSGILDIFEAELVKRGVK